MAVATNPLSREARRTQTRAAILEAAIELFAKQGIDATSFEHIARQIGLTKGAVYWHFPTKNDLVMAVVETGSVGVEIFTFEPGRPLVDQLQGMAERLVETAKTMPASTLALDLDFYLYAARNADVSEWIRGRINAAITAHTDALNAVLGTKDVLPVPSRDFVVALVVLTRGLLQQLSQEPDSISRESIVTLFRQLGVDKGRRR